MVGERREDTDGGGSPREGGSVAVDIDQEATRFVAEVKDAAGGALVSVVLYGSAASPRFVPGKSDINFLVVCEHVDRAMLERLRVHVNSWKRRRIALPLVVTGEFLTTSTDTYPLEILGMQALYRVLAGTDPFAGVAVDKPNVRLQAEREIKAKKLLLRQGYLDSAGDGRKLMRILAASAPAITAILRGMVYLKDGPWNADGAELRSAAETVVGPDAALLDAIWETRRGGKPVARGAEVDTYMRVLDFVQGLSRKIDE